MAVNKQVHDSPHGIQTSVRGRGILVWGRQGWWGLRGSCCDLKVTAHFATDIGRSLCEVRGGVGGVGYFGPKRCCVSSTVIIDCLTVSGGGGRPIKVCYKLQEFPPPLFFFKSRAR